MALLAAASRPVYERHRPEATALYEVVRDNIETLYGAIDDGALDVRIPRHARKELEAHLDCGLLCRGFARLRCGDCAETRLVAFSCKQRDFCPSCLGRPMCQTAANLVEHVLPGAPLRQWVLTFPFAWRRRLAQDGELLGALTRIFVDTVSAFYEGRASVDGAKSGAITVIQRTSWTFASIRTSTSSFSTAPTTSVAARWCGRHCHIRERPRSGRCSSERRSA